MKSRDILRSLTQLTYESKDVTMTTYFFTSIDSQALLEDKIRALQLLGKTTETEFAKERNALIIAALQSFSKHGATWDENVRFSIENVGEEFWAGIKSPLNDANLNLLFTICLRFFMESYIFSQEHTSMLAEKIKNFAINRQSEFDKQSDEHITYILKGMPLDLLRKLLNNDNAKSYRKFIDKANEIEKSIKGWEDTIKETALKSEQLNDSLVMQLNQFNFVGLHKGFTELGDKKAKELRWAKILIFACIIIIPIPMCIEFFLLSGAVNSSAGWTSLIQIIPFLSLTIIFIYFFRVALVNFNSVRAQLIQIDLRKSLCQFIQNYAEYAKGIREKNTDLLVKFEDIVFSNIMPSGDKIPSTFDGLEQISNLISALKKGG